MILAGHYPTMHFDHAQWRTMPVHEKGQWAMPGYYRTTDDRGKPLVFFAPKYDPQNDENVGVHFVVRPIVRVPMGKA